MIGPLPGTFTDKKFKVILDVIYTYFSRNENIVLHYPAFEVDAILMLCLIIIHIYYNYNYYI